jgi:hypothetical protein
VVCSRPARIATMSRLESWTEPAGESPARVSVGAPGSRPQSGSESSPDRAGRQEPLRREQERGPQHHVNPAASSDSQRESRAAHVTAKATSGARDSGRSAPGPPGVGGTARAQGPVRNKRDPSLQPTSGKDRPYKPTAKSAGAERESEGAVVPAGPSSKGPATSPRAESPPDALAGLDERLVQGTGPSSVARDDPLSGSCVAMPRRPSVSRVRENRTHGLKGGCGNGLALRAPRR